MPVKAKLLSVESGAVRPLESVTCRWNPGEPNGRKGHVAVTGGHCISGGAVAGILDNGFVSTSGGGINLIFEVAASIKSALGSIGTK